MLLVIESLPKCTELTELIVNVICTFPFVQVLWSIHWENTYMSLPVCHMLPPSPLQFVGICKIMRSYYISVVISEKKKKKKKH